MCADAEPPLKEEVEMVKVDLVSMVVCMGEARESREGAGGP